MASICSTGEWLGCVCVYACVCVCVATEKQNNGTVLMMLLVVSVVGVGTEFRDVLVEKLRLFDGHGGGCGKDSDLRRLLLNKDDNM